LKKVLLKMIDITKEFPGVKAVDSVDFELFKGEIHCLVGMNGAGKSTFIKIICGAYTDYKGNLFMNGKKVRITHPLQATEIGIIAIQQHRDLVPTLNGVENIFLGMEQNKGIFIDEEKEYKEARKIIDRFDKTINLEVPIRYLTVAEQEIIAIAKALIRKHQILILDEATAPLGRNERDILLDVLKELKNLGDIGIILISHQMEELFEVGDRVTVFKDGKLVATKDINKVTISGIIKLMIGEEERKRFTKKKIKIGREILKISNLNVHNELYNVSMNVNRGEIVGVAGRIGSNKEKIAEAIFGLKHISSGEIYFKGEQLKIKKPEDAIKKGIGLLPIDRRNEGLVLCRSISQNTILTWINKMYKGFLSVRYINDFSEKYIDKLGIKTPSVNQRVEYLSGGNQQKVVMAKWLAADVDLLILLEPTEGIDVKTRWEIYQILKDLARDGKGILVISSDLDEIVAISDRVFVMRDGKMIYEAKDKNIIYKDIFNKVISASKTI